MFWMFSVEEMAIGREEGEMCVCEVSSPKMNGAAGNTPLEYMCVNTIRCIGADLPQKANSGHPGAPMGCAPIAHVLWSHIMKYNPDVPDWINRDRFILSNGHACALLYTMLHLTGYPLSRESLLNFRTLHSSTPGHPESTITPGVEVCTGPLGQGIGNGVGMAIAVEHLMKKYNREGFELFDNFIYVLCGDGCVQEGVSAEACSLAGHLGLGRLIVLYDDNGITIDGSTNLAFSEDILRRYEAYRWQVLEVKDGDTDLSSIAEAIKQAKECTTRPSFIKITTTIGYGSIKAGSEKSHGAPLGAADISNMKANMSLSAEILHIPDAVQNWYNAISDSMRESYKKWMAMLKEYEAAYPSEFKELTARFDKSLPAGILDSLPRFQADDKPQSTRVWSGLALNKIAGQLPDLIGGSADLSSSNGVILKGEGDMQIGAMQNRYIHFGIREHAMAAACNGLMAYGGFRPFCATFLNFLTYAWGAVRLSALSESPVLYIATHDSIELGQDGPTHQAIEVLALVRCTPNILAMRPADGNEVSGCYKVWLTSLKTPVVMSLCRSDVPNLEGSSIEKVCMGAYTLMDFNEGSTGRKFLIAGSGSELHMCVKARALLIAMGHRVRVVSFPCWRLLQQQSEEYKEEVLMMKARRKGEVTTVYVEASFSFGWDAYFDVSFGMRTFGASASREKLWEYFGFTAENIARQALAHTQP